MKLKLNQVISQKISGEWGEDPTDGGVAVLRTTNFTNLGHINFDKVVYRQIGEDKISKKRLYSGDTIIEKSGGGPKQPVGRVVYFDRNSDEIFLCNNFTAILRPDRDLVHPKFLFYQMFVLHGQGRTLKYQNKTTGIINLKLDEYLHEKINIPSLTDQIKIAQILTQAEKLIAQRKESIALLDEYLKSTFLEMFGDPVRNEKGWKTRSFDKIGKFRSGGTPSKSRVDFWKGEFPWVSPKDMKVSKIVDSQDHISELVFKETSLNRILPNHLLIVVRGMILVHSFPVAINTVSVAINQDMKAILPVDDLNIIYLQSCLSTMKRQILNLISSAGHGTRKFDSSAMQKLLIPIPPPPLQTQFAQIVEKTEALKSRYEHSLRELEQLFGSLSQRAFKGELDLSRMEVLEDVYKISDTPLSPTPPKSEKTKKERPPVAVKADTATSIWLSNRKKGKTGRVPFTPIEGNAVLRTEFARKDAGFHFQAFEAFLKNEGFEYEFEQVKDFLFEKLEQRELLQYCSTQQWMEERSRTEASSEQDDFLGDGHIWLVVNNKVVP